MVDERVPLWHHWDMKSQQFRCYVRGVPEKRELWEVQPRKWLAKEAATAFARMYVAAQIDGIDLAINSAFRFMNHQQRLWDEYHAGKRRLRPARPGYSKHQSGLAADILRSHDDPDGAGPEIGPTDEWLKSNAHLYGFRRTVPAEPWHWEYVGVTKE